MVVDDLVVFGAEPLFMTDYIACGKVVPSASRPSFAASRPPAGGRHRAGGRRNGGTSRTAGRDEYDVAGAATGVVEGRLLGPERVMAGDVVIGMASSGIHSNGYSLVRRVINTAGWALDR